MHVTANVVEVEIPMTREDVAKILNVGIATVDRYRENGLIEYIKFGGNVRFTAEAVSRFIDSSTVKATA